MSKPTPAAATPVEFFTLASAAILARSSREPSEDVIEARAELSGHNRSNHSDSAQRAKPAKAFLPSRAPHQQNHHHSGDRVTDHHHHQYKSSAASRPSRSKPSTR